jgi:hypothetical protein
LGYNKWLFILCDSMIIFIGAIWIHRGWVLPNIDLDPDAEPPCWWKYVYYVRYSQLEDFFTEGDAKVEVLYPVE